MIIDSQIWKYELKKEIEYISLYFNKTIIGSNCALEHFTENDTLEEYNCINNKAFFTLQKFVFYTAIIIRKLIEANKLSSELLGNNFSIISYLKNPDIKITKLNRIDIEDIYELEFPKKENINLKNLTDKIIHSFHFLPKYKWKIIDDQICSDDLENWSNEGLEGFYFSSDKSKDNLLSFVSFESYKKIVTKIIEDHIIIQKYTNDTLF